MKQKSIKGILRLTLLAMIVLLNTNEVKACDNSSITLVSQTTNPDGSITYSLNLLVDHGGLDAVFYGCALAFNSSVGTPTVVMGGTYPTTSTISNSLLTSGSLSGTLVGLTGSNINSVANDSDWNQFGSQTNVLSYESGSLFGAISNDISFPVSVTVMGCVETIVFYANVNSGAAACIYTVSTGQNCATCAITNLSATPSVCSNNTYSVSITVTYSNPPATGTLNVLGQSFPITSSPQTVVISGLTANGASNSVTAQFSASAACSLTVPNLFTAPAACVTCNANAGTFN